MGKLLYASSHLPAPANYRNVYLVQDLKQVEDFLEGNDVEVLVADENLSEGRKKLQTDNGISEKDALRLLYFDTLSRFAGVTENIKRGIFASMVFAFSKEEHGSYSLNEGKSYKTRMDTQERLVDLVEHLGTQIHFFSSFPDLKKIDEINYHQWRTPNQRRQGLQKLVLPYLSE